MGGPEEWLPPARVQKPAYSPASCYMRPMLNPIPFPNTCSAGVPRRLRDIRGLLAKELFA